jgi:hypothetical protein
VSALTQNQSDALNLTLRNTTALGRLSVAELNSVFSTMTADSYAIWMIGSSGTFIQSAAEFERLAMLLCSTTAMSRLSLSEALAAMLTIQTLGYFILRPAAQGTP